MIKNAELLIIGGGPAGLCAAKAAAELGARVLLIEKDEEPGGQLVKQTHKFFGSEKQYAGDRGIHIGRRLVEEVNAHPSIEVWCGAAALGIYEDGIVTVFHENRHKKIRPGRIIIATGAAEKFLAFPGNDLPGIYGAGAVQTLMNVAGVKPAQRVLMVGAGNIGLIVSYQLMQAGVEVAAVVEAAPNIGGFLVHASKIRRAGVPILTGYTVKEARGNGVLESVTICRLDENFQQIPGTDREIPCDTMCLAVGLTPLTELCFQAGCRMEFVRELSGHVPLTDDYLETTVPGIYAAGDVSGIEEASSAMVEGRLAGCATAAGLGHDPKKAMELADEAAAELKILRSGPAGTKIRAGLKKAAGMAQRPATISVDSGTSAILNAEKGGLLC